MTAEFIAGGTAGSSAWALANPFDVVKSRIQASDRKLKLIPVVKKLYAEEGKVIWFSV